MQRLCILLFSTAFIFAGCSSTNLSVQNKLPVKGKRIGIGNFNMQSVKKKKNLNMDTVCACIGQSIQGALTPYLQEAGFSVVILPQQGKSSTLQTVQIADSLHLDYVLTGSGLVEVIGSSSFVNELSVKAVNMTSGEVAFSGSFSGIATHPAKGAGKIGKELVKKLK